MTPTYEEMLKGATEWGQTYRDVRIVLKHHGFARGDEYQGARPHPGIWCYYLIVSEEMYPHRWQDFAVREGEYGYDEPGPAWDNVQFDSEITFSCSIPYKKRSTGERIDQVKVGCDYGHLWHEERGYPDTYQSVLSDARRTVDSLLEQHPDCRFKSEYSHRWGSEEDFYIAVNGKRVHKDDEISDSWMSNGWQPANGPDK